MTTDTSALERLLSPLASSLDEPALRSLIGYRADASTQQRVDELAEKCNAGKLSSSEEEEYQTLVDASRVIAVLKAEAKKVLSSQSGV